mgnify:CR=1 FL=1
MACYYWSRWLCIDLCYNRANDRHTGTYLVSVFGVDVTDSESDPLSSSNLLPLISVSTFNNNILILPIS